MGKVLDNGSLPPDDPMFLSGPTLFIPRRSGPAPTASADLEVPRPADTQDAAPDAQQGARDKGGCRSPSRMAETLAEWMARGQEEQDREDLFAGRLNEPPKPSPSSTGWPFPGSSTIATAPASSSKSPPTPTTED